jgi:hypothetical protein
MRKTLVLVLIAMLACFSNSASAQISCPAGKYLSGTQCLACAAGKYCPAGTTSANMTACPLGKYCPAGAAPVACSAGTFNSTVGTSAASACKPCAAGTFSTTGAAGCTDCQTSLGEWSAAGASACTQVDCSLTTGYQGKGSMCSCKQFYGPGPVSFGGGIPRGCAPMSCTSGPFDAGSVTGQPGQCVCALGYSGTPVSDGKQIIGGCKAASCAVAFANMAPGVCASIESGKSCTPACAAGYTASSSAPLSCYRGQLRGTIPACAAAAGNQYCQYIGGQDNCSAGKRCTAGTNIRCSGQVCFCNAASCDAGHQCAGGAGECKYPGICK